MLRSIRICLSSKVIGTNDASPDSPPACMGWKTSAKIMLNQSSLRRLVFKHTTDGGTVSVEGWAQRLSPSMATWMWQGKNGLTIGPSVQRILMPGSWGSRLPLAYQSPCQVKHKILANLATFYVICIGLLVPKKWQKLRVFRSLPTVTVQVKIPGCWVFILKQSFQNQPKNGTGLFIYPETSEFATS